MLFAGRKLNVKLPDGKAKIFETGLDTRVTGPQVTA
jgi:hypothetical protein